MASEEVVRLFPEISSGEELKRGSAGFPRFYPSPVELGESADVTKEPKRNRKRAGVKREIPDSIPVLHNQPMRNVRAREARGLGKASLVLSALLPLLAVAAKRDDPWLIILYIIMELYLVVIGLLGLFARRLFIDGNYFLAQTKGAGFERFSKNEVSSVWGWSLFPDFKCLRLGRRGSLPVITVVRKEDLKWILFNLPLHSLPPDWRRRFGSRRKPLAGGRSGYDADHSFRNVT